ncbi:unnamed protein product [Sphenostylis stenocarpa]|uniref:Uncharacterized protein n=1 Tax=Sphenostylis stenocarpa TaxID=92480 RepID=A0AA86VT72_9FABA|nr:unnamed protein product [Sphenostylis stenocarpa]
MENQRPQSGGLDVTWLDTRSGGWQQWRGQMVADGSKQLQTQSVLHVFYGGGKSPDMGMITCWKLDSLHLGFTIRSEMLPWIFVIGNHLLLGCVQGYVGYRGLKVNWHDGGN